MNTPANISRRLSMSAIVQAITTYGPVSRASVAKMTGLSKQTVSEVVSSLETDGWVRTVGQTEGHVGRRAVVYEIMPDAALVVSVDLGGTKVRVALCDLTGAVVAESAEATNPDGGTAVVTQISRLVLNLVEAHGLELAKVRVAVVGVPGVPDPSTGNVRLAPNIKDIDSIDFAGLLAASLGIEVVVENDVNLAALGEHWITHQSNKDDLVYLSIGTGIGSGVVIGGELVRGATGAAGEIGYLPFGADPFEPKSRETGALERVSATRAITDHYENLTGSRNSVPEIFEAALAGDAAADQVLETAARFIAQAIGAIAAVIDPSVIVVGGSIGSRKELLDKIRPALNQCFPWPIAIEPSVLGNHAALAGGTCIALSRLHIALFSGGLKGAKIIVRPPQLQNYQEGAA